MFTAISKKAGLRYSSRGCVLILERQRVNQEGQEIRKDGGEVYERFHKVKGNNFNVSFSFINVT